MFFFQKRYIYFHYKYIFNFIDNNEKCITFFTEKFHLNFFTSNVYNIFSHSLFEIAFEIANKKVINHLIPNVNEWSER